MLQTRRANTRGQRTRQRILEVATELFARRGFDGTRLEDVAEGVGVRRAALVYYFRDKQELYDAVLAQTSGLLVERFQDILDSPLPPAERMELMVDTWVDVAVESPWLARLMLREAAATEPGREPAFAGFARRLLEVTETMLAEGRRAGVFTPVSAVQLASALAGPTIWFVAVMPSVAPAGFDAKSPREIADHREQVHMIARRLLGVGDANRAGTSGAKERAHT